MIYGMGCDISEVARVQRVFDRPQRLARCFSPAECALIAGRPERIAGHFSAKEALAKALGTGFRGFSLKDIEILRDGLGRPYVTADSLAKIISRLKLQGAFRAHLSISHEKDYAMATCLLEMLGP